MRLSRNARCLILLVGMGAIACPTLLGLDAGYRFNLTPSLPMGLYRVTPVTPARQLQRGSLVVFCPAPDTAWDLVASRGYAPPGSCAIGTTPLMKTVAGLPGYAVVCTATQLVVGDTSYPIQTEDRAGRALPRTHIGARQVRPGHVLVLTPEPWSFDSRYAGDLAINTIQGTAIAMVTKSLPTATTGYGR